MNLSGRDVEQKQDWRESQSGLELPQPDILLESLPMLPYYHVKYLGARNIPEIGHLKPFLFFLVKVQKKLLKFNTS